MEFLLQNRISVFLLLSIYLQKQKANILDQSDDRNRKQEMRARLWAYDKKIGLHGIINAYEAQRTSIEEMANFLNVTPEFLRDAIKCYKGKYGHYVTLDNYIIFFEPNLSVAKMIWD